MSKAAQTLAGLINIPAEHINDTHIENVAREVCLLLGSNAKLRLQRKVKSWPQFADEADDLCQLAALAFIEAYRQGRIRPNDAAGVHTPDSVQAYLWGICNRVFLQAVRRGKSRLMVAGGSNANDSFITECAGNEDLLSGLKEDDDESRLWEVLTAVSSRCHPEDIVLTWLNGCGFTCAEIQKLLSISRNVPANAIKRVCGALRELFGLESNAHAISYRKKCCKEVSHSQSESPFELMQQKRFGELLELLEDPFAREVLLREAAIYIGPIPGVAGTSPVELLSARQQEIRSSGDWSWGLLSAEERRAIFARDAALLKGAGISDGGVAQQLALRKLVGEMGSIFHELDDAILGNDLSWLLPLAEHLRPLLDVVGEFKEMQKRYGVLLETALRLNSPRLELLAQLGLCKAQLRLGDYEGARLAGKAARELAVRLGDRHCEANSIYKLGNVEFMLGNYGAAQEFYFQALAIRRRLGDKSGEANTLLNLGVVSIMYCKYSAARKFLGMALNIQRSIGDRQGEAKSLCRLGLVENALGDYRAAKERFREAHSIQCEMGERYEEAFSLTHLGVVEIYLCNYNSAKEHLEDALTIARSLDSKFGVENCLLDLGFVECLQGNYCAARKLLEEALAIQVELGDRFGKIGSLCHIGYAEFMLGNFGAARHMYLQAFSLILELGNRDHITKGCSNCGAVLAELGFLHPAALAIYGALASSLERGFYSNPNLQQVQKAGIARLEAAVQSGEITADVLAKVEGGGRGYEPR
jgi:tetratricopeptide (TPR) repeat protein